MRFPWSGRNRALPEPPDDLMMAYSKLHREVVELKETVEHLDADLDYLAAEVKRLRGTVTGGLRGKNSHQDAPEPIIPAPPLVPGTPEWMAAENLKIARR